MTDVTQIFTELKYNSHDVTKDFSKYLQTISYTDYEEEESDELSLTLKDNDKKFQNDWYPEKGAKLTCKAGFKNTKEIVNLGTFTIDENSFNFSTSGDSLEIKALATTTNSPLRTANTRFFEKTTLIKIAQEFGDNHGFKVIGSEGNAYVERVNQVQETDLAFLKRISQNYGYIFKLTDKLLTFTSTDSLISSDVLFTFKKEDIEDLSLTDSSTRIYQKCSVKYFNPKTKKLCTYTAKRENGTDTLKLTQKCSSLAEAKRVATAGLKSGSKEITGSISLKQENLLFFAGVNFQIIECGRFNGKYHIKSSVHNISNSGWKVNGEIEKCL